MLVADIVCVMRCVGSVFLVLLLVVSWLMCVVRKLFVEVHLEVIALVACSIQHAMLIVSIVVAVHAERVGRRLRAWGAGRRGRVVGEANATAIRRRAGPLLQVSGTVVVVVLKILLTGSLLEPVLTIGHLKSPTAGLEEWGMGQVGGGA